MYKSIPIYLLLFILIVQGLLIDVSKAEILCRNANVSKEMKNLDDRATALFKLSQEIKSSLPIGDRISSKYCAAKRDHLRARRVLIEFQISNRNCVPEYIRESLNEDYAELNGSDEMYNEMCKYKY